MKTVSGKVTSTKPISLSRAAKVLSNFVTAETGASQAVSAYLSRASAAFNELVQLHKELRSSKSNCKHKDHGWGSTKDEETVQFEQVPIEVEVDRNVEDSVGSENSRKKHKKKDRKKRSEEMERGGWDSMVTGEADTKERKKRKSREVDRETAADSAERGSSKTQKKKRKIEHD